MIEYIEEFEAISNIGNASFMSEGKKIFFMISIHVSLMKIQPKKSWILYQRNVGCDNVDKTIKVNSNIQNFKFLCSGTGYFRF